MRRSNKNKGNKTLIIVMLLMFITVGYALLSGRLDINGYTQINDNKWDIYFDNEVDLDKKVSNIEIAQISEDRTRVDFKVQLGKPGDKYTFLVDTVNDGTIDAQIEKIVKSELTPSQQQYLDFTVTYLGGQELQKCDMLSANGGRKTLIVNVEFKEDLNNPDALPSTEDEAELSFEIHYVQATECATVVPDVYFANINPNGGIYEGSEKITTVYLSNGQTYNVKTPIRENYKFVGWTEVTETESYSENVITMQGANITLEANWALSSDIVAKIVETGNLYTSIQTAFNATSNGQTVELLKNVTESVINTKTINYDLAGYTQTGSLTNNGDITIYGGIITSDETTITNNGTLTFGFNDEKVNSKNCEIGQTGCVIIIGETGLQQNGSFNFYDGYIEANLGLVGGYTSTPLYRVTDEGINVYYYPFVDHIEGEHEQQVYLSDADRAVTKTITNGEVYYYNVQDNINVSVETGYDIYAIRNFEAAYTLTIPSESSIVFDIKGYTVEMGNNITNNGTLTFKDSSDTKGILTTSQALKNNGSLNISNISISTATPNDIIITNSDLNIINSTITSTTGYAINIKNGNLTLDENSKLISTKYAVYVAENVTSTITGGYIMGIYNDGISTINTTGSGSAYNNHAVYGNKGTVTINGGKYTNDYTYPPQSYNNTSSSTIYGLRDSKIIINGGTYEGYRGIQAEHVEINDGNIKGTVSGVKILTDGIINGGTIHGNSHGIFLDDIKDVTINGGTITGYSAIYDEADSSDYNYKLTITGGIIKGTNIGLNENVYYSTSDYKSVYIYGGTIEGGTYGILSKSPYKTYLGKNDGEVSIEDPVILGGTYGYYNEKGTIYFYDGIIKGGTDASNKNYDAIVDAYTIHSGNETINEKEYITNNLEKTKDFLEVDGVKYNSLKTAINSIEESATIKVIDDGKMQSETSIPEGKTIELDLNGHTLEFTQSLVNNGKLTINDLSSEQNGKIFTEQNITIINSSKELILEKGLIENKNSLQYSRVINIKSGIFVSNNIEIKSAREAIKIETSTSSTITGGKYTATNEPALYASSNLVVIEGGEFKGTRAVFACNTKINGGTFNGSTSGLTIGYNCKSTINGGTFTSSNYGIELSTAGAVTINDAIINGYYGIFNEADYNQPEFYLKVNGGTITGTKYGLYNKPYYSDSSNISVYLNGGTFKGGTSGVATTSAFKVKIGQDDGEVSKTKPELIGGEYGYYKQLGTVDFYDGILKGTTSAIYGEYDIKADGYSIENGIETINDVEYKTESLVKKNDFLEVNGETYNSLGEAINSIDTEGTIKVIDNSEIKYPTTIPSGKIITIDLNGYTIDSSQQITNNGKLIIDDLSVEKNGKIINSFKTVTVLNNNELIIKNGELKSTNQNLYYYDQALIVNKNGTLKVEGGTLNANQNTILVSGGSINVDGGNINSDNKTAIVGMGGTSIYVNGGTITGKENAINCYEIVVTDGTITSQNTGLSTYSSTATINGGTIHGGSYGINSMYSNLLTINGGKITGSTALFIQADSGRNEYNKKTIINNGEIIGTNYGILEDSYYYKDSYGMSTYIYGGTIIGGSYGLYSKSPFNTYIGKDDQTINISSPVIQGNTYGIYKAKGTISFYDGIIKGKTSAINDSYNSIASTSSINTDIEIIDEEQYETNYLITQGNFVKNGTTEYSNLQTAIEESTSGDTLELIANASIFYPLTITETNNVTLDLKGYNINISKSITNNGIIHIINTSENVSTINTISLSDFITNNGELEINNINIVQNPTDSYFIINNSNNVSISETTFTGKKGIKNIGTITMEDSEIITESYIIDNAGEVSSNNTNYILNNKSYIVTMPIYNHNNGTMTLGNGTAYKLTESSAYYVQIINETGEINFNNFNIDFAIYNQGYQQTATMNINQGKIMNVIANTSKMKMENLTWNLCDEYAYINSNNYYYSRMYNSGDITINNVQVEQNEESNGDTYGIIVNHNKATIDGLNGSYYVDYGLYRNDATAYPAFDNSGTLVINNSNMSMTTLKRTEEFKFINNTNIVEINNSTLSTNNTRLGYGIYQKSGKTNINNSNINAEGTTVYGIYNENGTVTIGEKETEDSPNYGTENADVSTTLPCISSVGTTSGIGVKNVSGYFNFYDGKVTGSTSSIPDTISSVEYNYERIDYTDENGYQYSILEYMK